MRRGNLISICLALTIAIAMTQSAAGITVILKGATQPIRGFVVSENDREIVVRVPQADGTAADRTILKTDIDLVHRPVSIERLSALDPDRPIEYRDYAEELADKKVDPEAREMSLRLFVIAAHLDPVNLGRSSLLGMTALAPTAADERRYRALAYLLDPEHDRSVLKEIAAPNVPQAAGGANAPANLQRVALLRGLELLRKGRTQEAGTQLRREGVEEACAPYAEIISFQELLHACRSRVRRGPAATPELTAKILQLELKILGESSATGEVDESAVPWASLSPSALEQTAKPLEIDTITQFDPSLCVYREGKWVAP